MKVISILFTILIVSPTIFAFPNVKAALPKFNEASYIAERSLPSTLLIVATISYQGTFYVPWTEGTESYTVTGQLGVLGSGFFVNSDGYIITNGHVVFCIEHADFTQDSYTKNDVISDGVEVLLEYLQEQGYTFTQDNIDVITNYNLKNAKIGSMFRSVSVILGESKGNIFELAAGYEATVVSSTPFLGRDLALLKISLPNTPALIIAKPEEVETGMNVYALGYPGIVTFHPDLSTTTLLVPSFTSGVLSAKRTNILGIPALQHSAETTFGNSGGPLVDEQGHVVGVNNMGSIGDLGVEVAGFNFAVSNEVILDFLRENGVQNYMGNTNKEYDEGLAYYYAGLYSSAKKKFDTVKALFPYHWEADLMIQKTVKAIATEGKAVSKISVALSTQKLETGKNLTVYGTIEHVGDMPIPLSMEWPSVQIILEFTKPDKSTTQKTIVLNSNGTFTSTLKPDAAGLWSMKASWTGNDDYSSSSSDAALFTVEATGIIETLTQSGLIYAVIIVPVIAVVAILVVRKRKTMPPPPPPSHQQLQ